MDNLRRVEHKKSRISSSRIEPISPDVVYTSGARVFPVERSDLLRSDRWKSSSGQVYENRHHLDSSPALNQGDYYTPAFPLNRPSSSSIRAERSQKAAWIWTCGICIVLFLVLSIVIPLVLSIMGVSTGASTEVVSILQQLQQQKQLQLKLQQKQQQLRRPQQQRQQQPQQHCHCHQQQQQRQRRQHQRQQQRQRRQHQRQQQRQRQKQRQRQRQRQRQKQRQRQVSVDNFNLF
ncbi:unnamed protein product [Rotaria magnacalcarata]|uniref:Uncharacterized protein n=1 Tax=Rotaria magnacalcarata TaxID=392030 RepID=A0A819XA84_9BILA|nr:unnamed protein product [Rotaria magnacalcarata]